MGQGAGAARGLASSSAPAFPVGFMRDSKIVVAICVLIVGVVPSKEVAFGLAVMVLGVLRPLHTAEVRGILYRIWPILVMIAIALVMTLIDVSGEFDTRAIIRIFFYYARIPVFIMLGFGARKYLRDPRTLLWMILLLGIYTAGSTILSFLSAADLSGLSRTSIRQIVGGGDPVSVFIPIIARILWTRDTRYLQVAVLLGAVVLSLASVIVTTSRTGLLVIVLSLVLSLPRLRPLQYVRWGVLAIMVLGFAFTTPTLQPVLTFFSIDPASLGGFNEVIARPRYDAGSINDEWRGYETFMAFTAAEANGVLPLIFGHGLSATADLGISIELSPGEFFTAIDIFHNGYSFIVLHSGLIGILLYWLQMWLFSRPQAALRDDPQARVDEDLLYVLVLLSLASSTAVIAGMFNASTFAQLHLFLIGCFYPLRRFAGGRALSGQLLTDRSRGLTDSVIRPPSRVR